MGLGRPFCYLLPLKLYLCVRACVRVRVCVCVCVCVCVQEQVNRIVHLGWLYDALRNYIQAHQPNFGTGVAVALHTDGSDSASSGVGVRQFEVYKAAMSLGLSDLLEVNGIN